MICGREQRAVGTGFTGAAQLQMLSGQSFTDFEEKAQRLCIPPEKVPFFMFEAAVAEEKAKAAVAEEKAKAAVAEEKAKAAVAEEKAKAAAAVAEEKAKAAEEKAKAAAAEAKAAALAAVAEEKAKTAVAEEKAKAAVAEEKARAAEEKAKAAVAEEKAKAAVAEEKARAAEEKAKAAAAVAEVRARAAEELLQAREEGWFVQQKSMLMVINRHQAVLANRFIAETTILSFAKSSVDANKACRGLSKTDRCKEFVREHLLTSNNTLNDDSKLILGQLVTECCGLEGTEESKTAKMLLQLYGELCESIHEPEWLGSAPNGIYAGGSGRVANAAMGLWIAAAQKLGFIQLHVRLADQDGRTSCIIRDGKITKAESVDE